MGRIGIAGVDMLVVAAAGAAAEATTTAVGAVDTIDVMVLFLDFGLSSIDRYDHTHTLLRNVVDGVLLRTKNRTFCVCCAFFVF